MANSETAAISLYFDVPKGEYVDLAVAARAAIAWNDLIKEMAYILDPSLTISLELVNGTGGSLFLNSLARAVTKVKNEHPFIVGPLIAIGSTFAISPVAIVAGDAGKAALEAVGYDTSSFSDKDLQRVAQMCAIAQSPNVAGEQKRKLFSVVSDDPKILGLGVSASPEKRPNLVVPRSEFVTRSGVSEVAVEEAAARVRIERDVRVTVAKPDLDDERHKWKFKRSKGERFSATMADTEFLAAMRADTTGLTLRMPLELVVDLRVTQHRHDGVWRDVETVVERVVFPPINRQPNLQLPNN